jgi:uncharacterized damage-inducible protein DinB
MFGHQAWADAELWRAIEACAPAGRDAAIRGRWHHIHLVQRGFLWVVGDRSAEFQFSKPEDFAELGDLKAFGMRANAEIAEYLPNVDEARLCEQVTIPWFQNPPLSITVAEALTQCAMHSQWHRGQNATRLRELGGDVPLVDLIIWMLKGRPRAEWS